MKRMTRKARLILLAATLSLAMSAAGAAVQSPFYGAGNDALADPQYSH